MSGTQSVDLVGDEAVSNIALAALLAALTAAFAYVSIPLPGLPAPVSFQVFGVYFAGLLLGPRWGGFSIGLYLLAGIAGAPVFSNAGSGLGYVVGPTGGYLVGFLLAAVLIGAIAHRSIEPKPLSEVPLARQVVALLAGLVCIYAVGVPWLVAVAGLPPAEALTVGALIFLPGDAIKIAATLALVKGGVLARQQSTATA
ncbi:biotin transporter BioY [Haloarcula onubensis]|uniref:Biotin transporter BioY n=1 Tax=Haloarcula onubensis TaxID=2950539 RepID=A0ABU2FIM6_9EURY|nr:biotin transporter BioY [Halomicroarcula sp. S3CR25-11]MDS0280603.1 biotin transporter BioY [Halomicroarcula sp. S3CR25-11]